MLLYPAPCAARALRPCVARIDWQAGTLAFYVKFGVFIVESRGS